VLPGLLALLTAGGTLALPPAFVADVAVAVRHEVLARLVGGVPGDDLAAAGRVLAARGEREVLEALFDALPAPSRAALEPVRAGLLAERG
jgi:hypothetical protein